MERYLHRLCWLALLLVTTGCVAKQKAPDATPVSTCRAVQQTALAEVWNADVAARLELELRQTTGPKLAALSTRIVDGLARVAASWQNAAEALCDEPAEKASRPPALRALEATCLEGRRMAQGEFVRQLEDADMLMLHAAAEAVWTLGAQVEDCHLGPVLTRMPGSSAAPGMVRDWLARRAEADIDLMLGGSPRAQARADRALAVAEQIGGAALTDTLVLGARVALQGKKFDAATLRLNRALGLTRTQGDAFALAAAEMTQGAVLEEAHSAEGAEKAFRNAERSYASVFGLESAPRAKALQSLGRSLLQSGDSAAAAEVLGVALRIFEKRQHTGKEWLVAFFDGGRAYAALGQHQMALGLFEKQRVLIDELYGVKEQRLAEADVAMAFSTCRQGRPLGAIDLAEQALSVDQRLLQRAPTVTASAHEALGVAQLMLDERLLAARAFGAAIDAYAAQGDAEPSALYRALLAADYNWFAAGDYAAALGATERALVIVRQVYGKGSMELAAVERRQGHNLTLLGRRSEAYARYAAACELLRRKLGPEHEDSVACDLDQAGAARELGQLVEASVLFGRSCRTLAGLFGEGHVCVAGCQRQLGHVKYLQGELTEAQVLFEAAEAIYQNVNGDNDVFVAETEEDLGLVRCAAKDFGAAVEAFGRALEIRRVLFEEAHPSIAELKRWMSQANKRRPCVGAPLRPGPRYWASLAYLVEARRYAAYLTAFDPLAEPLLSASGK